MACQIIQHTNSHQQQTGAQKAHNHITGGRLYGSPVLPDHNQAAGGNGIDLHKYIGGKQIIGIDKGKQRGKQQITEYIIQVGFPLLHLVRQLFHPAL